MRWQVWVHNEVTDEFKVTSYPYEWQARLRAFFVAFPDYRKAAQLSVKVKPWQPYEGPWDEPFTPKSNRRRSRT